jgi:hypothetical protein
MSRIFSLVLTQIRVHFSSVGTYTMAVLDLWGIVFQYFLYTCLICLWLSSSTVKRCKNDFFGGCRLNKYIIFKIKIKTPDMLSNSVEFKIELRSFHPKTGNHADFHDFFILNFYSNSCMSVKFSCSSLTWKRQGLMRWYVQWWRARGNTWVEIRMLKSSMTTYCTTTIVL